MDKHGGLIFSFLKILIMNIMMKHACEHITFIYASIYGLR